MPTSPPRWASTRGRSCAPTRCWVDAGVEQLVVRLDDVDGVRACDPDPHRMAEHMTSPGRPPHVYAWAWSGPKSIEARLFYTQGQAVLEDPATGSACANLGGWLVAQGVRDVSIDVSQGAAVGRPSRLLLDIDDRGGSPRRRTRRGRRPRHLLARARSGA